MSARIFRIGRARTGLGFFATKPIKRGAYIATYRGPRITNEEADRREARGARYLFTLNKRWTIDGSPRWNMARYINHSCKPNARPVGRNGGIVIVADRRSRRARKSPTRTATSISNISSRMAAASCAACIRKRRLRRRRAALSFAESRRNAETPQTKHAQAPQRFEVNAPRSASIFQTFRLNRAIQGWWIVRRLPNA